MSRVVSKTIMADQLPRFTNFQLLEKKPGIKIDQPTYFFNLVLDASREIFYGCLTNAIIYVADVMFLKDARLLS